MDSLPEPRGTPTATIRKGWNYLTWRIARNFGDQDFANPNITMARFLRYHLHRIAGNLDYLPFVVITSARTGSNLLMSMLDNHPSIYVRGECMSFVKEKDVADLLRKRVYAKQPRYIKAVGFKAFFNHPYDDHSGQLWTELESKQALRIVLMTRRNKLKQYVSMLVAAHSGIWWQTKREVFVPEREAVTVDPDRLLRFFVEQERNEQVFKERFDSHPVLHIEYERLVTARATEFTRLTRFLGVAPLEPETVLHKQNSRPLSSLVRNGQELAIRFRDTKWYEYFDDAGISATSGSAS